MSFCKYCTNGEISEGQSKISEGHNLNLQHTKSEMERIFGKTLILWVLVCVCVPAPVIECVLRMCSGPALPFPRGQRLGLMAFWGFSAVTVQDFNFSAFQSEALVTGYVLRAQVFPWITQWPSCLWNIYITFDVCGSMCPHALVRSDLWDRNRRLIHWNNLVLHTNCCTVWCFLQSRSFYQQFKLSLDGLTKISMEVGRKYEV